MRSPRGRDSIEECLGSEATPLPGLKKKVSASQGLFLVATPYGVAGHDELCHTCNFARSGHPCPCGNHVKPPIVEEVRRVVRSIALSGINASLLSRQRLPNYAKSSTLSGITRSAAARRQQLDVPRPPNDANGEQHSFSCLYCFRLIKGEN